MIRMRVAPFILLLSLAGANSALPQQQKKSKDASASAPFNSTTDTEAGRFKAIALLNTLDQNVNEVDGVEEQVRVLTELGDALWLADEEHARAVLTRGFQQITKLSADTDAERGRVADRAQTLRRLVLACAAKHDPSFARRLAYSEPASPPTPEEKWGQTYGSDTPKGDALLAVAQGLLSSDTKKASALAGYAVTEGLSQSFRLFLIALRAKDRPTADELFKLALKEASDKHPGRLFDVLILWDYAYQPSGFYLGAVSWDREKKETEYDVPLSVKREVLNFALTAISENAQQLTLPPDPNDNDTLVRQTQPALIYSVIQQLLPSFQINWPDGALTLQQIVARVEQDVRAAGQKLPAHPRLEEPVKESTSIIDQLLERAAAATQSGARDELYLAASFKLLQQRQYERAMEIAAKIDDLSRKAAIVEIICFNYAGELSAKGNLEDALKMSRNINAPDLQVTVLARIGQGFFDRGDLQRGTETINQAQLLVNKAEPKIELCAATLSIAAALLKQDPTRAYELIGSAIQMMNKIKSGNELWSLMYPSNGSDSLGTSGYSWQLSGNGGMKWVKASFPRTAGIAEVLSEAAKLDFDESLVLSRRISSKGVALAVKASICRTIIEATRPKKVRVSQAQ
jgi:hypothetical protein